MRIALSLFMLLNLLALLDAEAADLRVAVATNFSAPAKALKTEFIADHAEKIDLVFGSSGTLAAQIEQGAPIDIFLSADEDRVDRLLARGLGVTSSKTLYAVGRLLVWHKPARWPCQPEKALHSDMGIAIANPRLAPYGQASLEVLEAIGVEKPLLLRAENIATVYTFIKTGNAEVAFIAASFAKDLPKQCLWPVPDGLHRPIRQAAMIVKGSKLADDFMAFLGSRKARHIIKASGYDLPRRHREEKGDAP